MEQQGTEVDFWFDPLCPYAWITSRWIAVVEREGRVRVRWHPMGLGHLNDGPGLTGALREILTLSRGPTRVVAAVEHDHGAVRVGDFYTALGTRLHSEDGVLTPIRAGFAQAPGTWKKALRGLRGTVEAGLADAGLPTGLAGAADDRAWDEAVLASHALVPSGDQTLELLGVPTISVNGAAGRFGPVLDRIPGTQHACRLWEAFATLATDETCYEIKRVTSRADPLTFTAPEPGPGERMDA